MTDNATDLTSENSVPRTICEMRILLENNLVLCPLGKNVRQVPDDVLKGLGAMFGVYNYDIKFSFSHYSHLENEVMDCS